MENKEKYYTPKITDIRIGYECEVNWAKGYSEEFEPLNTSLKDEEGVYDPKLNDIVIAHDDGYAEFRTPYLSKEDIESEGWVLYETTNRRYKFEKIGWSKKYSISFLKDICPREAPFFIYEYMTVPPREYSKSTIYQGKCLSINELRYITRELLGIE